MNQHTAPRKGWQDALSSIRGKLTLLGTLGVLAVLGVLLVELVTLRGMLTRIESEELTHRVARARRVLERRIQQKTDIVTEFAIWDEAFEFASDPHGPGSEAFVRDNYTDWLPARYGDRVIKIWNREHEPLVSWADSSFPGLEDWIPSEEIIQVIARQRTVGGFLDTPRGLFLVGASVILRSNDQQMVGEPNGFVFAGQPVDEALQRTLSRDLQEGVRISRGSWLDTDSIVSSPIAGGDSTSISFPIKGLNGDVAGIVELRGSRAVINDMHDFAYRILAATLAGGVLILVILWLAMKRLVIQPLGDISGELEQMQLDGEMRTMEVTHPATEWQLFSRAFNNTVRALKNSEERYHVLFRRAGDGYILLDSASETILEANPAAEVMAGCSALDMVGRPFARVFDLSPAAEQAGTFTLKRPDGSSMTVGRVSTEVQLAGLSRTLVSIRDISQYERLQVQLRQAQKMEAIGSLAGGVAHDFNNLLGAILVANSSVRSDVGRHDVKESLDTIEQAARRASELTRQLLRLARQEQPRNVPLELNEVVNSVATLCRRTFNRAIRIDTRLDQALPAMIGDPAQLEQAVLNLCINARDAMPDGGILTLSTRMRPVEPAEARDRSLIEGMHISLMVEDTGTGLSFEAERHLFEPFFTTKERGKGNGLGLATSYGTVRAHGGALRLINRPGTGASFEMLFPPTTASAVATGGASRRGGPPAGERILVIDDEASLRSAMSRSLERLGYSVQSAEGGWAGVKAVEEAKERFDLVLLDVIMPDMNGVETLKRLRAIQPDLPVLVCSGYSAENDRRQLLKAGAGAFLPKPFDTAELAEAVREALLRHGS